MVIVEYHKVSSRVLPSFLRPSCFDDLGILAVTDNSALTLESESITIRGYDDGGGWSMKIDLTAIRYPMHRPGIMRA